MQLTVFKKQLSVKNRIAEKHDIQVNFSDKDNLYLSAYSYFYKSDQEVAHSKKHPPGLLRAASPKAKKSVEGFHAACDQKRKSTEGESSRVLGKKQKI